MNFNYGTIQATYGEDDTPVNVFVSGFYYCVEGSVNINIASVAEDLVDGCDLEKILDVDTMTAIKPVESLDHLEAELEDDWETFFEVSQDTHDIDALKSAFKVGEFEEKGRTDEYKFSYIAAEMFINGNINDAIEVLEEREINPLTMDYIGSDHNRNRMAVALIDHLMGL